MINKNVVHGMGIPNYFNVREDINNDIYRKQIY